jgi:uncharacterized protein (DUF1810 family)
MQGPFNLERFVTAQASCYDRVLAELRRGHKSTHWMWFIFPQIAGLGRSPSAQFYALASLDEARAYLNHPVLGPRLIECAAAANAVPGGSAYDIFGGIDEAKFRSSLTLFAAAAPDNPAFQAGLDRFFDGQRDPLTLERLDAGERL